MIDPGVINFYFGEVVKVEAYQKTTDTTDATELFTVYVDVIYKSNKKNIKCKPASNNIKQIPNIGENVLIFQGYHHTTKYNNELKQWEKYRQWYYMPPIGIQSSVNSNVLPINTEIFTPDATVPERTISSLQPFKGDILYEGRWGNSIRLGSTITTASGYDQTPTWSGTESGDPIILISNSAESKPGKDFIIEDIKQDPASLYLTSTQKIPGLLLGETNKPNSLTCFTGESIFNKSQLIGVADRIMLKAKTDIAVIDAPRGIVLNTTGEVKIGSDDAAQSMVHGDELLSILQRILNQLNSPIMCGGLVGTFMDLSATTEAQSKLQNLLSKKYFIKK